MQHEKERKEQLEMLISQYQDLLFIEEQKLIGATDNKTRNNIEQEINRYQEKIRVYINQLKQVESPNQPLAYTAKLAVPQTHEIQPLIDENFENNQNKWWTGETAEYASLIQGGVLMLEVKEENGLRFFTLPVGINLNENFAIEATMRFINGYENNGFGICWGKTGLTDFTCFEITVTNYYTLRRLDGGETWRKIVDWTSTHLVHGAGIPNKLKIVRQYDEITAYLNQAYLFKVKAENFVGENIGFVLQIKKRVVIDDFKVWKG